MKRSPLQRKTPLRQRTPIKRVKTSDGKREVVQFDGPARHTQTGRNAAPIPTKIREALNRRSMGRCEARLPGCTGSAEQAHHRKLRAQGGLNNLDTLIDVCRHCHHGVIHANVGWAYRHGWLVKRHDEPADRYPIPFCDPTCPTDHYL